MECDFNLVLEDEVEQQDPLYETVGCQDGKERSTGGVRVAPDVIELLDTDYPDSVLPTDTPSIQGISPFSMVEENEFIVYESADFTDGHKLHGNLWVSIQVNNLGIRSGYDEVDYQPDEVIVGSDPDLYEVDQMALYCPEKDIAAMERLDVEGEIEFIIYDFTKEKIVRNVQFSGLDFYDVPDTILLESLPEEYNPEVVANNI